MKWCRNWHSCFRNADGSTVGRDPGGNDIYYPVYEAGQFHIAILKPSESRVLEVNQSLDIEAAASDSAGLSISVNGTMEAQVNGKSINYNFTPTAAGNYLVKFSADNGTESKGRLCLYYCSWNGQYSRSSSWCA